MRYGSGWFILLIAVAAVVARLLVGRLNHSRIREYIAGNGGEVLGITWEPFGRGWFGEKDSVIYSVRYRDREGNIRNAHCKTSMFSGVYFTDDVIVTSARSKRFDAGSRYADPEPQTARGISGHPRFYDPEKNLQATISLPQSSEEIDGLRRENERLKEENRRLNEEIARLRG